MTTEIVKFEYLNEKLPDINFQCFLKKNTRLDNLNKYL